MSENHSYILYIRPSWTKTNFTAIHCIVYSILIQIWTCFYRDTHSETVIIIINAYLIYCDHKVLKILEYTNKQRESKQGIDYRYMGTLCDNICSHGIAYRIFVPIIYGMCLSCIRYGCCSACVWRLDYIIFHVCYHPQELAHNLFFS